MLLRGWKKPFRAHIFWDAAYGTVPADCMDFRAGIGASASGILRGLSDRRINYWHCSFLSLLKSLVIYFPHKFHSSLIAESYRIHPDGAYDLSWSFTDKMGEII